LFGWKIYPWIGPWKRELDGERVYIISLVGRNGQDVKVPDPNPEQTVKGEG